VLPTINWLLATSNLRLRIADGSDCYGSDAAARRDEPITWVHSSDLADPTPFLSAGNLLLTDGSQFGLGPENENFDYPGYVLRLIRARIIGLGFATHFLHQGTPPALALACSELGLPLIEIPDRVPFIAVIRRVADQIAEEQNRRLKWSLDAHKAISRAALKPNGLGSILIELERQLSCWVGLFDAMGKYVAVPTQLPMADELVSSVAESVAAALKSGKRSASNLTFGQRQVTMQTLGQSGQLRGVLALGRGVPLDKAENELVASVIALASLALEQNRALDAARGHMRSGLLELLIAGSIEVAERTATQIWGKLPLEPVTVYVTPLQEQSQYVLDSLELFCEEQRGAAFFAVHGELIVMITEASSAQGLTGVLSALGHVVGASLPVDYRKLQDALDQSSLALRRADETDAALVRFDEVLEHGMLGLLHTEKAEHVAKQVIAPLVEFDAVHGTDLVDTVRAWLENGCSWDRASKQLGMHRHTLRNRIGQAGSILHLDLESFDGRLEVWATLSFLKQ
jgi:purine catabolism regulator